MPLALPEPDYAVVRQRRVIVADLRRVVAADMIIDDEEGRRAYETDALTAYRRLPLAVALPGSRQWPRSSRRHRLPGRGGATRR